MKLEIEMYVRTNYGLIGKIIKIYKHISGFYKYRIDVPDKYEEEDYIDLFEIQIIKKAYKPIDLIEFGDIILWTYYNSKGKNEVIDRFGEKCIHYIGDTYFNIEDLNIKRILTKEQFESIGYKTEEE